MAVRPVETAHAIATELYITWETEERLHWGSGSADTRNSKLSVQHLQLADEALVRVDVPARADQRHRLCEGHAAFDHEERYGAGCRSETRPWSNGRGHGLKEKSLSNCFCTERVELELQSKLNFIFRTAMFFEIYMHSYIWNLLWPIGTVAKGNIREDSNPTHTCEDILVTEGPNPQSAHWELRAK